MDPSKVVDKDSTGKKLFKAAMKGNWKEVVEIYESDPAAGGARITKYGDTVLHIAVSDGQQKVVEDLVDKIMAQNKDKAQEFLWIANDQGNTALHRAASMGNAQICERIAKVNPSLLGARNNDNETPLFLSAFNGKLDAFLCLNHHSGDKAKGYYRGKDGDTILHVAIRGEYLDLAFQIIHMHPDLVNSFNEQGVTPLHLLASKPTVFRSGSHISGFPKMVYNCTFMEKLQVKSPRDISNIGKSPGTDISQNNLHYPDNYKTCMDIFWLLRTAAQTLVKKLKDTEDPQGDAEKGEQSVNIPQGHQLLPPNYVSLLELVKLVSKALLVILGLGSMEIKKMEQKKKNHIWSVQIMNELLNPSRTCEYEHTGRNPAMVLYEHTGSDPESETTETRPFAFQTYGSRVGFTSNIEKGEGLLTNNDPDTIQRDLTIGKDEARQKGSDEKLEETRPTSQMAKKETPILTAAKNGIREMVEKIVELYPIAIHDITSEKKNVVLLAVENRQPHVYEFLLSLKRTIMKDSIFHQVDDKGNSALHLAATLGDYKPWRIPGAALQMQWESKWYQYVKRSMPRNFFVRHNNEGKTAKDIFSNTHQELVKSGGEWLIHTSESCSVVAALIATVAFATSATVPGGVNQESGAPTLENQPAFNVFAISSLIALCFSVTAVVMFLSILTSRHQEKDFGRDLPRKLLVGLSTLFVSIAAILVSFCAGHFFVLKDKLKFAAFPVYAVTCLPVTFFAIMQFPLYFDLIWAFFKKVPQRSYMVVN